MVQSNETFGDVGGADGASGGNRDLSALVHESSFGTIHAALRSVLSAAPEPTALVALLPPLAAEPTLMQDAAAVLEGDPDAAARFSATLEALAEPSDETTSALLQGALDHRTRDDADDEAEAGAVAEDGGGLVAEDDVVRLLAAAVYADLAGGGKGQRNVAAIADLLVRLGDFEHLQALAAATLAGVPGAGVEMRALGGRLPPGIPGYGGGPRGGLPRGGIPSPGSEVGYTPHPEGPYPGPGEWWWPGRRPIIFPGGPRERWISGRDIWHARCIAQTVAALAMMRRTTRWVIDEISPEAACPGAEVTLVGSGFGNREGGVLFPVATGVAEQVGSESWSDTEIRVRVPERAVCGRLGLAGSPHRVHICGRHVDVPWPGECRAWFGGGRPHVSFFNVNGRSEHLPVEPGDTVTASWSTCAGPGGVVRVELRDGANVLQAIEPAPVAGATSFSMPPVTTTRQLTWSVSVRNSCGGTPARREVAVRLARFADLTVQGIEATQSLQYYRSDQHLTDASDRGPTNSLPLVARKATVVRVYVESGQAASFDGGSVPGVTATLRARRLTGTGSIGLGTLTPTNAAAAITAQRTPAYLPTRRDGTATLNFLLPEDWCVGRVSVEVRLDPEGRIGQRGPRADTWTEVLDFTRRRIVRLRGVMVAYDGPDGAGGTTTIAAPTIANLMATTPWMERVFPISDVTYASAGTTTLRVPLNDAPLCDGCCTSNWLTLNNQVQQTAQADGMRADSCYYGLLPAGVPIGLIVGCDSGVSSGSVGDQVTLAHEVGHNVGLQHGPCGTGSGDGAYPAYEPYDSPGARMASLGEFGYDSSNGQIWDPQTTRDLMSYCGPRWVSLYHYLRFFNAAKVQPAGGGATSGGSGGGGGGGATLRRDPEQPGDRLYLSGVIAGRELVHLDRVHRAEGLPVQRGEPTGWRVVLLGADDEELAHAQVSGPASLQGCPCHGERGEDHPVPFAVSFPFVDGVRAVAIERAGKVVRREDVPQAEPDLDVAEPEFAKKGGDLTLRWSASHPEGAALTYWVRCSSDDGKSWAPLAVGLTEPRLELPLDQLPSGPDCLLQVVVHDGIHSVYESVPVAFPERGVQAVLIAPAHDDRISLPVQLRGEGWDPRRGVSLEDEALSWESDRDGPLGGGKRLTLLELSPGRHEITLRAVARDGAEGTASVTISVEAEDVELTEGAEPA